MFKIFATVAMLAALPAAQAAPVGLRDAGAGAGTPVAAAAAEAQAEPRLRRHKGKKGTGSAAPAPPPMSPINTGQIMLGANPCGDRIREVTFEVPPLVVPAQPAQQTSSGKGKGKGKGGKGKGKGGSPAPAPASVPAQGGLSGATLVGVDIGLVGGCNNTATSTINRGGEIKGIFRGALGCTSCPFGSCTECAPEDKSTTFVGAVDCASALIGDELKNDPFFSNWDPEKTTYCLPPCGGGGGMPACGDEIKGSLVLDDTSMQCAVSMWCNGGPDLPDVYNSYEGDVPNTVCDNTVLSYDDLSPPSSWETSAVKSFKMLFKNEATCNPDIDAWQTSLVTSFNGMFESALLFNQPLDSWQVDSVNNMFHVFNGAKAFNQNIDSWQVDSVTGMGYMFYNAAEFDQPLNSWQVGDGTIQAKMFDAAGCLSIASCGNQD